MDSNSRQLTGADSDLPDQDSEYYRDGIRNMTRIIGVQGLVILALSGMMAFMTMTQENGDLYFAVNAEGRKMPMTALRYPNMGRTALATWISGAATQIMTFGFNDINERFQESQTLFTPSGWKNFRDTLSRGAFLKELVQQQQILTAVLADTPVIMGEGLNSEGVYTWTFTVKMLITIRAGSEKKPFRKTAIITVERVPTGESSAGVGIGNWLMY